MSKTTTGRSPEFGDADIVKQINWSLERTEVCEDEFSFKCPNINCEHGIYFNDYEKIYHDDPLIIKCKCGNRAKFEADENCPDIIYLTWGSKYSFWDEIKS